MSSFSSVYSSNYASAQSNDAYAQEQFAQSFVWPSADQSAFHQYANYGNNYSDYSNYSELQAAHVQQGWSGQDAYSPEAALPDAQFGKQSALACGVNLDN